MFFHQPFSYLGSYQKRHRSPPKIEDGDDKIALLSINKKQSFSLKVINKLCICGKPN